MITKGKPIECPNELTRMSIVFGIRFRIRNWVFLRIVIIPS